jgi:hypothetical protein
VPPFGMLAARSLATRCPPANGGSAARFAGVFDGLASRQLRVRGPRSSWAIFRRPVQGLRTSGRRGPAFGGRSTHGRRRETRGWRGRRKMRCVSKNGVQYVATGGPVTAICRSDTNDGMVSENASASPKTQDRLAGDGRHWQRWRCGDGGGAGPDTSVGPRNGGGVSGRAAAPARWVVCDLQAAGSRAERHRGRAGARCARGEGGRRSELRAQAARGRGSSEESDRSDGSDAADASLGGGSWCAFWSPGPASSSQHAVRIHPRFALLLCQLCCSV